jgi:hypothetical protein
MLTLQRDSPVGLWLPRKEDLLCNSFDLLSLSIELIDELPWHDLAPIEIPYNRKTDREADTEVVVVHLEVKDLSLNVELGVARSLKWHGSLS